MRSPVCHIRFLYLSVLLCVAAGSGCTSDGDAEPGLSGEDAGPADGDNSPSAGKGGEGTDDPSAAGTGTRAAGGGGKPSAPAAGSGGKGGPGAAGSGGKSGGSAAGSGGGSASGSGGTPASGSSGTTASGSGGTSASGSGGTSAAGNGGAPAAGSGGKAGGGGAGGSAGKPAAGSGGGPGGGGKRCGTRGGVQCGGKQFCNFEPDADCGATDRGGVCETKPDVCRDVYEPVCGCNNRTYGNDCEAHAAGVSVKRDGMCSPDECTDAGGRVLISNGATIPECASGETGWNISGGKEQVICCVKTMVAGRTCGGIASLECDGKQFCNYEESAGGQGCDGTISDAAGVCQETPTACTREYQPVCGCDRRTYGNTCEAHSKGASILHDGACTESECESLGGRVAFGLGPAPMCNANETEHGSVVGNNGQIPIEGALCCLP